jgi:hypothetical protein
LVRRGDGRRTGKRLTPFLERYLPLIAGWGKIEPHLAKEYGWDVQYVLTVLPWRRLRMAFASDFVLKRPTEDPYAAFAEGSPTTSSGEVTRENVWEMMDKAIGRETPRNVKKMSLAEFQGLG